MKKSTNVLIGIALLSFIANSSLAQLTKVPATDTTVEGAPVDLSYTANSDGNVLLGELPFAGPIGASQATLVIPKDGTEPKGLADLEEDLNVMARILAKATRHPDDKSPNAMGIVIHSNGLGPSSGPRNLYLEGYGALFFLNASFPLLGPATKNTEEESKEDTSSEWEEAKKELHQGPSSRFNFNLPQVLSFSGSTVEEFDAEKVEKLKTDLVQALKNAAHIRRLKSDESVTVIVTGPGRGRTSRVLTHRAGTAHGNIALFGAGSGEGAGARLVLRARKSDIDSFQKDKLSTEEFRKKVSVLVY